MNRTKTLLLAALVWALAMPAAAHINMITPTPLLDGHAKNNRALKAAPFGAPGFDVEKAPATVVKSGSTIDLELEIYVYHPGRIVVSYTRDFTGADVPPVMSIESMETEIPHKNVIFKGDVPPRAAGKEYKAKITLPEITGTIILVVRQIMTDKMDVQADGSVSLKRIYYHQAAKLELVE